MSKKPTIGSLRHRVEIHAPTNTVDEIGNQIETWAKVADAWASIEPISGREYWAAAQVQAETTHRVTMRADVAMHPSYEIVFGARRLAIEAVTDTEEKGVWLVLMCKEKR